MFDYYYIIFKETTNQSLSSNKFCPDLTEASFDNNCFFPFFNASTRALNLSYPLLDKPSLLYEISSSILSFVTYFCLLFFTSGFCR